MVEKWAPSIEQIRGQRETAIGSAAPACAEREGEENGVYTLEINPEELMVHAWMSKEKLLE